MVSSELDQNFLMETEYIKRGAAARIQAGPSLSTVGSLDRGGETAAGGLGAQKRGEHLTGRPAPIRATVSSNCLHRIL